MERIERHFEETPRESALHEQFNAIKADPHLQDVIWEDLEMKDMMLLEKFSQGTLTEEHIRERVKVLEEERRELGNASFDFAAILLNKLVAQKYFEGHRKENE